jgi:folate-binding protein YgfZ
VSGPDRLSWLHSLTSQHLEHLAPGVPTETLVLSPHGHVEHHLALVDDGEATWAHLEPGTAEGLVGYLDSMRFWSKVEVEDVSTSYAVVLRPAPVDSAPTRVTAHGVESFIARADLEAALDGELAGVWALEALRIAAGRPRFGLDTDHRTIPHEVGWIGPAVHLDKGCYRGQETVARVQNLGRPPRRLVLLHLDGSESVLPAHGEPVLLDDRQVGTVTSAARHFELGPIALALVKRSTPVEAPLVAGGVAAAQEVVVAA